MTKTDYECDDFWWLSFDSLMTFCLTIVYWLISDDFLMTVSNMTIHTGILLDWTLEKLALSSFAFESFWGLIRTRNKNIFLIPVRDS